MSHRLQVLVALFLGAAVGAGIVSCTQQPSSQATAAREPAAAPQWEYKVTNFDGAAAEARTFQNSSTHSLRKDGSTTVLLVEAMWPFVALRSSHSSSLSTRSISFHLSGFSFTDRFQCKAP